MSRITRWLHALGIGLPEPIPQFAVGETVVAVRYAEQGILGGWATDAIHPAARYVVTRTRHRAGTEEVRVSAFRGASGSAAWWPADAFRVCR